MKIERDSVRAPDRLYRSSEVVSRPSAASGGPAAAPVDQVSVSEEARRANAAREQLAAQPQVRAALVQKLKAQIEQGAYNVHSNALAEKLLKAKVLAE
ncbi:MAG TPA: flagellar biosynthesis anti-sigma factor FlgM [Symbiobacteriaceae bacterium]|jgi:flagellar biosynthesis anti-sigma factor FlgM